tara:strand:+ start:31955 stop:32899 length:945 start_codon:yes stop_codon:yes gene_type:complete
MPRLHLSSTFRTTVRATFNHAFRRAVTPLLITLTLSLSASVQADVTLVRHPQGVTEWDQRNDYFIAVLRLALDKTHDQYGDYLLEESSQPLTQSRAIAMLSADDEVDVLWSMTSRLRETQMLPVRIPLLKGLMGYRLFIIRAEDEMWFKDITTLDQLRELRAGQGHDWPDAEILRSNGLHVETSVEYENLFRMLHAGRFDFLPRAINEPWEEVKARKELDLSIEKNLLLYYPTASYFFVSKNNPALAERLRTGLEKAIADGSFETLLLNHPINAFALKNARMKERHMLKLVNPLLPAETPLERKELWWQMGEGE